MLPKTNGQSHIRPNFDPASLERLEGMVGNLMSMRSSILQQLFDPRRNIDDECGYPSSETGFGSGSINVELYRSLYERECIATRVVQVVPKECWQVTPFVFEDESPDVVTPFEEAWDNLTRSLFGSGGKSWYQDEEGSQIWEYLKRADILSRVGHFGVLLLGFDDGLSMDQPVEGVVSYSPEDGTRNTWTPNLEYLSGTVSLPVVNEALRQQVKMTMGKKGLEFNVNPTPEDYEGERTWLLNRQQTWNQYVENVRFIDSSPQPDEYGRRTAPRETGSHHDPRVPTSAARTVDGHYPFHPVDNELPSTFQESSGTGTDAQYVGIQLSPPEYPSSKPSSKAKSLIFMRAFDESLVQIVQYEANVRNPRFGQPVMYRITLNDPREQHSGIGLPMATIRVHWSRIIHLNDVGTNAGPSEIFSPPVMRPVLNRLLDLRKILSASAEGYWKSAFAGLALETNPQLGGDVEVDVQGTKDMMEQYFNGLQRYLLNMGMTAKTLAPVVSDPTPQVTIQIQAICIQLGIPQRVFMGSERGELASSQDDAAWNDRLKERQRSYVTPRIIIPFIDRLISAGVLPEPKGYSVEWPDIESTSESDKAAIALQRTQALTTFASNGGESMMTPAAFYVELLGVDEEKAQQLVDDASEAHDAASTLTMPPNVEGRPAEAPEGTQDKADADTASDQFKAQQDQAQAALAAKPGGIGSPKPSGKKAPATNERIYEYWEVQA